MCLSLYFIVYSNTFAADACRFQRQAQHIAMAAHAKEFSLHVHDRQACAEGDQGVFRETGVRQEVFLRRMPQGTELQLKN